jgi:hypothetical protein
MKNHLQQDDFYIYVLLDLFYFYTFNLIFLESLYFNYFYLLFEFCLFPTYVSADFLIFYDYYIILYNSMVLSLSTLGYFCKY